MIPDAPYDDGINIPLRAWLNQLRDYVLRYVVRYHVKELSGTTSGSQGAGVTVAHGLTSSKIVAVSGLVFHASGQAIGPGFAGGYNFNIGFDGTNVSVNNVAADSANILSKSFVVYVTYKD